ncbi:MAG: DUF4380 domain-containing protein [Ignavibacteriaceae bacterium]
MKNKLSLFPVSLLILLLQLQIIAQNKMDSVMILNNGSYQVSAGNVDIVVNPAEGGRITSFKLGDYDFLIGKDIIPGAYGSTFWPGPQSDWNWPPPAVLDNKPYSAVNNGNSVKLTSGKDPVTGFQFSKELSADKANSINLAYTIVNKTDDIKKVSPWEISRVHKGGLFFFPMGKRTPGVKMFEPVNMDIIDGIVWYKDELKRPEKNKLSTADGSEGWTAYAINGKLFIKKFKDVNPEKLAPGEGEVMLYVDSRADFVEYEIEGQYETLKPGEALDWNIKWIGINIPANIKVEKGSRELVDFVRKIIGEN